jgi:hypothetical protein
VAHELQALLGANPDVDIVLLLGNHDMVSGNGPRLAASWSSSCRA